MTTSHLTYILAACLLFVSLAQAQTSLLWKFGKGQVFDVERTASQKQTVEIEGKHFKQQRQSAWHVRLEVKEKQAANVVMLALLTKVEHHLTGGADADSIDPKLHEKMQGSSFTLTVTPDGRIVQLQGYEDFLKRVAGMDKARLKALGVTFPESALKEALADLFGPLPQKSVANGDAWQREYVEPIPHFGSLRSTASYTYEGQAKKRERIAYTIQTRYEAPPKDDKMAPFRVVKGRIDSAKAKGMIAFDQAAGRLVEHERTMLLRGTLTIEVMDREQPLKFSSENEVKIRLKK
jgi:Family of unknown function (DUF6263)